jgi:hypothetical protein
MPLYPSIFVGWSKPLAHAVASSLLASQSGTPIDLGSHRVIVPSSFASRLIQEELAKQAPNGVLLPVFQTPTDFLNFGDSNTQAASSADGRLNQSFEKYRELIPGVGALAISPGNHEVRSKALTAVRAYLSGALLLAPKGQSAYAKMRDREAKELPEYKD